MIKLLIDFKVGDEIPSLLSYLFTMSAWLLQISKIRKVLSRNYDIVNTNDLDKNSDEYKECVKQLEQLRVKDFKNKKNSLEY